MSVVYCHSCDQMIDTDYHVEHFDELERCALDVDALIDLHNRQTDRLLNACAAFFAEFGDSKQ